MTEVRLAAPVQATPVRDAFEQPEYEKIAGAFSFEKARSKRGLWGWIKFTCPCGCNSFSRLPIGLKKKPPQGADPNGYQATWEWDGNRETPTLTPSINHVGHWHGFLTKGFFTQA